MHIYEFKDYLHAVTDERQKILWIHLKTKH
ncbi:hypothetical protein VQ7734_02108 [Vibrio quintilis]|uniref:Uncharacterized protein n=1 Tax=Vibrio quintilis TaxID=1117707 RepID=A0A1M7YUL7_9VIBR|nr:hypothetical protein VQ7734_02108 [Vibrio quintilis]